MQRLSDIMSHAGLSGYAEVALILFLVAFAGIVLRVLSPRRRQELEAMARMPLEDDGTSTPSPGARP
jgi:cbb3-type cytochrome oxidase subunit 3